MSLVQPTDDTEESTQATLTDTDALREARVEAQRERALDVDTSPYGPSAPSAPEETGGVDTTCQHCENVVAKSFVRIFGDNHGRLHCCLECATFRELQDGCGAREGYQPDDGEVNW